MPAGTPWSEAFLAPNWIGVGPDGSTEDRAKFVKEITDGVYAGTKLDSIDVQIIDAGAAIGHGMASDNNGKYHYSDVFVKKGGSWKAVYSQLTKIG